MTDSSLDNELSRVSTALQQAFQCDGRYALARFVGNGSQGAVYKLDRVNPAPGDRTSIAIKLLSAELDTLSDDAEEAAAKAEMELRILTMMRGAAHVSQMLDIPNNPLMHHPAFNDMKWVYLDWLPNGTLADLAEKAEAAKVPLPNRLLWRLFLCMMRSSVACAWADVHDPGTHAFEAPQPTFGTTLVTNDDLHSSNLMFGAFSPTPAEEHALSPPLAMIDFGISDIEHPIDQDQWITHAAEMVVEMKVMLSDLAELNRPDWEKDPRLDPDLKQIMLMCSSREELAHPTTLFNAAMTAVRERDEAWYAATLPDMTDGSESDLYIQRLVQYLILEPHPDGYHSGFF